MNIEAVLLQTITPILSNQSLDTIIGQIEESIDMAVLNGTSKSNVATKNAPKIGYHICEQIYCLFVPLPNSNYCLSLPPWAGQKTYHDPIDVSLVCLR